MAPRSDRPGDGSIGGRERRVHNREVACAVAEIVGEAMPQATALIRNVSESGAMLLTRVSFEVGEIIDVVILLSGEVDGPVLRACGEVMRAAELDMMSKGVWGFELGVKFLEPLSDHAEELRELTAKLARDASTG